MHYILPFHDHNAENIQFTGGKGANLAKLTRAEFPVPTGFIVTAPAYREFIAQFEQELKTTIDQFDYQNPVVLNQQATSLRQRLDQLPLPVALIEEIQHTLKSFSATQSFAVRSSSTLEDLAAAAFAGQHDTYLNCIGEKEIIAKIKACFISLWQDRAISYRHQNHFDHLQAAMAVVIQTMVNCDVAGVGFSINPINGQLDEMILNANFGLGESVVSGEGEIDQFILDKNNLDIKQQTIAHKTQKIIADQQGTKHISISETNSCLTIEQIHQLGKLLIQIEEHFYFPQDIEWGIANEKIYLLQSRPVTTIPEIWTRDESAERYPNVITPLTWDWVDEGFHISLDYSLNLMNLPIFKGKWFAPHNYYIYGNQNAVKIYMSKPPVAPKNLDELRTLIPHIREKYQWVQELPLMWARDLDHYLLTIGALWAESIEHYSLKETWDYISRVRHLGNEYFKPNIAISITQKRLYQLLFILLKLVADDRTTLAMLDGLTAYCETKTGLVNKELFALAELARSNSSLKELLLTTPARDIIAKNLLNTHDHFYSKLQNFLTAHGHRETDFDPYHPTWLEAPWVVLDNIRLLLQVERKEDIHQHENELKARAQKTELALFQLLPDDLHFFYHEIIRLVRTYTTLDDVEHYQTTRLSLPLRKGVTALGNLLVKASIIETASDIYFAHSHELENAIEKNTSEVWQKLAIQIRQNKQDYLTAQNTSPAWTLQQNSTIQDESSDYLSGLAGSPGNAEGNVYIVNGPDDFADFPNGAVLVARTTNPAWTPLFYNAIAVITESGGPLSHGAVVAREVRIPAVMSVRNVLSKLKNGQRVKVDGSQGKVLLVT